MNLCAPLDVLKSRHNDICDMLQLPLSSMPSASDVRLTGVAYIKALAEVYSANLQSDKSNRQCIRDMNASAQRLFQRLVVLRRQQLQYIGDSRYDVFLAHAGEDMFLYVDGQLNDKLKTSLNVFVDREAIQCADLTNDNGVDRGLLTSNVVLFVMSEHFICKPWPLYEFFFASARMDNEFESSGSGKIMVDSFHDPREISSNDWLSKLEQLALPWPAVLGGNMPPAVLSTHSRIVDHADRVIAELHKLLAAPSLASTHASSSAGTTTSARLICVFVLSGAIDIKDFCAELAPSCDPLSPALAVRSLHMHALTNRDDVSAPVLVALQLPSNAAIGRATRQDLAALIEVLQQPPLQTLWAAFFDTSTDEQGVLVSRASFVDDKFMPTTMPSPTLCEVDDTIHICALHVRANVACVAIAYVPQNNRDTLLLTISQQWVQHAAKVQHAAAEGGARRICHKFAFVQLHNVGGDVHTDRAAFWKEFGASFCAVVRSRSTEHFLVLPAHVGALMACLVRGGAWDAYLEWLAAQSSQVSVLGLPVRQVDAEAVRSLRMLRTDSIESFGYPAAFAAAVGEASWSERTNWIGSTDDDMRRLLADVAAVTFSLAQLDDDESALDVSRRASVDLARVSPQADEISAATSAIATGDANEMVRVGRSYADGVGVSMSFAIAVDLYERASDLGSASALFNLAVCYENGMGVMKSAEKAVELYERASELGDASAMFNLAVCYKNGTGVTKSVEKAVELYEHAIELGDASAMLNLAVCYENGTGVTKNAEKAVELYQRAADLGDASAMFNLGACYMNGTGVTKNAEKAVELYERAIELGNASAMINLAVYYKNGEGMTKSAEKAVDLYERAIELGHANAMFNLAVCYENGEGVTKSAKKAVELYERAIELGDASALFNLALCYENGAGVTKSAEKAVELYERASDLGSASALFNLAVCYENGAGVTKSAEKAVELYQRAADLGNASALFNLGACYMNGSGVAASMRIGVEFALRAAAMGNSSVKQLIDTGMAEQRNESVYGVVTGLLSGVVPDSATARKLLATRAAVELGDFVFDGDNFPLDRIGDILRLFAEFDRAVRSLQFAIRRDKQACTGSDLVLFARFANLVDGVVVDDHDAILQQVSLLLLHRQLPLELYAALKRVIDARVARLTVKSVLPLVCVLDKLDRTIRSLEFVVAPARFGLRACVFGAMSEHLLAAELPSDLTSGMALETTLLWLGVVRQAEFFGGAQMERVAVVERTVEARLRNDKAARDKYAMILVRDLKRRVPHLLLATPAFAAASATKLDGETENKRVKVILVGGSGVGKTQIRRRLGGVHAFEEKHTSTDTAEVTSVEVTSLCVASTSRWIERDDTTTSENVKLHGPAFARSLMFAATGVDNVPNKSSIPSSASEPERASSSNSGDARTVATMKSVAVAATSSDAPAVGVSETIASAMHADVSTSSAHAPAATSSLSFVPQDLNFSVMDERKVLSLWDFGGQVEYFAVHDLFLTSGAVYVLVVDWTKGVEKARESAQMWMNAIRAHVGDDAHVLPVLPRCSKQSDDDNAVDEVAREVKKLVGCMPVRVDSATGHNYDELKSQLLKLADACTASNGKVPMRWLQVHDELCQLRAEKKKQWVTRVEFRALLQSLHGKNKSIVIDEEDVLTFLKQSGTVLTCGGGGRVGDYVFLDPELFLQLVRPLINTHEQIAKRQAAALNDAVAAAALHDLEGDFERMRRECIATRALLEHLWRGVQSPTGDIGFFVELLEQCGLMCELERGAFFVPAASKASPIGGLNLDWVASGEQIAFVCESVSAVPPSLLPRVVASLFRSGAIDKLSRQRIVTLSDVVLLLRARGGVDVRRIRLLQRDNAFVMTLQRSRGNDEAAARAWRVCAYVALYCAIENALALALCSLKVSASVLCSGCKEWREDNFCSTCDLDLASIDEWLPRNDDKLFAQRQNWRVISATNESLNAFLERPTLDALLKWCAEHCDSVRAGATTCFPDELRELDAFWAAVRQVADAFKGRSFDFAVFYPGRESGGKVLLRENDLADAMQHELVKMGKIVYYADRDRHGSFDENIVAAVVGCRRAVFVVSRVWFERKWCLAEMLLAIATGDDAKCKVIQFGDDFRAELLPLHQRVLRERFDATNLLFHEATRLAQWMQS